MYFSNIAHELNVRRDVPAELYLTNPDRTAPARRARPAEPITNHLPHGVQPQAPRHHRVGNKMTVEEPEVRRDIQLTDNMAFTEFAAVHMAGQHHTQGAGRASFAAAQLKRSTLPLASR